MGAELVHAGGRADRQIDKHDEAATTNPNPQLSNYKSANLTPTQRTSVGCNGDKIVVRNRENLSVDFFFCNF
jgi:hypothetical protein